MVTAARHGRPHAARARSGLLLAAAAAAPFAAGGLLFDPAAAESDGPTLACPFRAATGLPCPLCGSTRAVVLAAHGDGSFVHYNAVVVLTLVALVLAGLALALARRDVLARVRAAPGPALLAVGVSAWIWTLTHQATITS